MQTAEESAAPEKRESQGLIQRLMNDTTTLAVGLGAVVALLALLWVMISRRRASSAEFQESILVNTVDESEAEPMTPTRRGGGGVEESSFLSDFTASDIDALQDETGEVDPIAEADVYIAYGRFRQAEELIRQAVDREPGRNDLIVKLFEILSATKDGAAFVELAEKQAADGFERRDADGWARVREMGVALAPGHPLFAGATAAGGAGDDAGLDLDIDLRGREGQAVADQGAAEYDIDVGPLEAGDEGPSKADASADSEFEELELPASKPKEGIASGFDFQFDREALDRGTGDARPEEGGDEIPGVPGDEGPGDDEVNTKLDLARAYVEMGDEEDAREILNEVLAEGDEQQRREAQEILDGIA
jgi:pilus assembly protein FimV